MSEAAANPRLMTRAEAKAYLRGVDPYQVCPPLSFGKRLLWDRQEVDSALTAMGAAGRSNDNTPPSGGDIEGELERARKRITKGATPARK
jgi:hypothetical protein